MQNISVKDELLYDGWSFEKYSELDNKTKRKIHKQTLAIAQKLKDLGYVGIGGIDYIIKDNNVYFMEINPRFQASSEGLDKILRENQINFKREYTFSDLTGRNNNKLRFDFAIFDSNGDIYSLIEIQGPQHYKNIYRLSICIKY